MNQVALVGRITKDPDLRRLAEGRMATSFTIAINRKFKNANGQVEADFVSCVVWGKLAANVVKYCGKGSLIGVGGRLQSRSYDRDDGKRVYLTEVVADEVRFIALKNREEHTQKGTGDQRATTQNNIPQGFVLPTEEVEGLPIV